MSDAPYNKEGYNPLVTFGFEQLTVDSTAGGVPLTATKYAPTGGAGSAKYAVMRLETAQIRYTVDGVTAPTTTVGTLLEIGESLLLWGTQDIQNFKAIRTGGSSGVLDVHYAR